MAVVFPPISILYEDDDILVINKPPGIVVNRSQTQSEPTLQDWIESRVEDWGALLAGFEESAAKEQSTQMIDEESGREAIILGEPLELFKERSGVVHRLDKDTSGVLLIAKHPTALIACMQQFKLRTTTKKYVALVHGKLQPQTGEINLQCARTEKRA